MKKIISKFFAKSLQTCRMIENWKFEKIAKLEPAYIVLADFGCRPIFGARRILKRKEKKVDRFGPKLDMLKILAGYQGNETFEDVFLLISIPLGCAIIIGSLLEFAEKFYGIRKSEKIDKFSENQKKISAGI